ncbi:MAG: DinB family protein, partial [Gemmatimonadaceae bacterium]
MHPRIAELVAYIDKQHENLRSAFELVPAERLMLRPAPDRWSPAEVVHHIAIVERLVVRHLEALVDRARALPPESDASSLFPIASATLVEIRSRRVHTAEYAIPRETDAERIWSEYLAT